jgi:hypothetical protein
MWSEGVGESVYEQDHMKEVQQCQSTGALGGKMKTLCCLKN